VTDDDRVLEIELDPPLGRAASEALRLDLLRLARRYGAEVRSFTVERVDPIERE
jgi:hypothetical protein